MKYSPLLDNMPSMMYSYTSEMDGALGMESILTMTYVLMQISSPACTELEVVMMDWLAKMLQLPEQFLSGGKGGGVIHVSPA